MEQSESHNAKESVLGKKAVSEEKKQAAHSGQGWQGSELDPWTKLKLAWAAYRRQQIIDQVRDTLAERKLKRWSHKTLREKVIGMYKKLGMDSLDVMAWLQRRVQPNTGKIKTLEQYGPQKAAKEKALGQKVVSGEQKQVAKSPQTLAEIKQEIKNEIRKEMEKSKAQSTANGTTLQQSSDRGYERN